jgi:hypothetical protein
MRRSSVPPFLAGVAALCLATACASAPRAAASRAHVAGGATAAGVNMDSVFAEPGPSALATRQAIPTRTLDLEPGASLHDVVRRYWPQVLRPATGLRSGADAFGDVVGIYINGAFAGGQEQLRGIRAGTVASVRRFSPAEESMRWGRTHSGGALLVTLRP